MCVERVPKYWIFGGLVFHGAFLARVWGGLMARRVEIDPPIVVLLAAWRAGALIMKLNGKSQMRTIFLVVALAIVLLFSIISQAQEDWQQFHGLNANGVAKDNPALSEGNLQNTQTTLIGTEKLQSEVLETAPLPDQEHTKESGARQRDCIYVPTPQHIVNLMLELANVKKTDLLYDLGCGDGRIVVTAAKKYGCKAMGFDIDTERVRESLANVKAANLEHLVTIEQKDIFELDLSEVDVVTLYLLPHLNIRLIPQLEMLKPGSRIVSHDYGILGFEPNTEVKISSQLHRDRDHYIYLWTVPLNKMAPTVNVQGHTGQRPVSFKSVLTYVFHSTQFIMAIVAAVLAGFFWCLRKRLGVIKFNVTIDRPQRRDGRRKKPKPE